MKPKPPCRDCEHRIPYCHSICPDFIKYRADLDAWNELHNLERERERRLDSYEIEKHLKRRPK